jgi:purine-binding chemotaxis protein CheW
LKQAEASGGMPFADGGLRRSVRMTPNPRRRIVLLAVGPWRLGLYLQSVAEVVRAVEITPLPQAPAGVLGVIDVHGRIVPVLSLRQRLGLAEEELSPTHQFVIIQHSGRDLALPVDEALGVSDLPDTAFTVADGIVPGLERIEGIAQVDGGLVLIEDLDRFLSHAEEAMLNEALSSRS